MGDATTLEVQMNQPIRKEPVADMETGEQTQITPRIKEIVDGIPGEGVVAVMKIADHIRLMNAVENSEVPNFTKTADEILKANSYDGCNEAGTAFVALLRAKGIRATYIQALNTDAVQNYSDKRPSLNGHVYLEADLPEVGKKIINSTSGEITNELPPKIVEGARGLDSWDIGLRNGFEDLKKMFKAKHEELSKN